MRLRRWFPTVAVFSAAAVALMALAGAGSAARTPAKSMRTGITLGSVGTGPAAMVKIQRYLRSVGIDPRTVVIQTAKRNYAGPKCPGKRWSCTTATRVLQAGSDNVFQCTPVISAVFSNSGGNQSCQIMQNNPSGSNTATCTEHTNSPTAVQYCKITQVGRNNTANVNQQNGSNGTTESASQTAIVDQSGATGTNRATITQTVAQDASGGSSLQQNGWARSDLVQSSAGLGKNIGNVTQRLTQNAFGGTTQRQDTLTGSIGDCNPPDSPANTGPGSPNLCSNSSQTGSGNGDNQMELFQKIIEKGSTGATASQQQGFGDGGIDGKIHQSTGSLGTNYNQVNQNKIQSLVGGKGSSQTQFDPMFCCGAGSQAGGNANNQESIGQGVAQDATESGADQSSDIVGESLSPTGSCDITQGVASNGDSANNNARQSPCTFLLLETSCEDGECTASEPVTTPPNEGSPESQLVKDVRNLSSSQNEYTTNTTVGFGNTIEYRVTYSNVGTGTATGVTITDVVPSTVSFTSCSGPSGSECGYNSDNRTITWTLGSVDPDNSEAVTFQGVYAESCDGASNVANSTDNEEDGTTSSNPSNLFVLC
jgi:uncharacterized repeat protein (TIGR01451 family)